LRGRWSQIELIIKADAEKMIKNREIKITRVADYGSRFERLKEQKLLDRLLVTVKIDKIDI